ncbi:MAG: agmatinase [Rhodospirillaceae bacterium]
MQFLPSEDGFLGLPDDGAYPSPADARAVIVPFGLEATVSYGAGTAKGPDAILNASHQVELFDEEFWCEPVADYGVATIAPIVPADPVAAALDQLETAVAGVLQAGKLPLVLGGEHSLTAGAIRPFVAEYPDLAILHFDAHADLRDGYEGEPFSHAAALRRCLDQGDMPLVSLGIRNISAGEIPFLKANRDRIHIHWAKDRADWGVDEIVAPLAGRPVYLTFDLDGFDASLMAATGTPEPGGLFWDDAMRVIRAAAKVSRIVGADVVELAPRDNLHACDFLAAKLAYKILSYALASPNA